MTEPATEEHLGGAYPQDPHTIMPDVWSYLVVKYDLKSVLDVGCGFGYALRWFADHGLCQIKGIEGWPEAVQNSLVPASVILHDFTKGPAPLAESFDLAWSAEFLEHVDEQYLPNFMAAFRLARHVCATHAEPGQGGHHHVNCRTTDYWIDVFARYGFRHDVEETAILRRTDVRRLSPYGRRTLMFFTAR